MDNKPLEKQAENYIKSQLIRFGFNVNGDLSFDKKGYDLMITKQTPKHRLKYLIIQCKGRNLKNRNSSVKIPGDYVKKNFILFVYIVDQEFNQSLFLFLPEEIKAWKRNGKNEYFLNFSKKLIQTENFHNKLFDKNLAEKINDLLNEPKDYTSIFIDCIFLEKAIDKTIKMYSEIWPNFEFVKPDLISIIKYILEFYNKYKTEKKIIICKIFMSKSFCLESKVNIDLDNLKFETKNGNQVKIFINKTDEIIAFEILEEIDHQIDNDNILLVANDKIYERELEELKKKGFDMIVIKFNLREESDMYSEFRWGDIVYPLGLALGLERNKL